MHKHVCDLCAYAMSSKAMCARIQSSIVHGSKPLSIASADSATKLSFLYKICAKFSLVLNMCGDYIVGNRIAVVEAPGLCICSVNCWFYRIVIWFDILSGQCWSHDMGHSILHLRGIGWPGRTLDSGSLMSLEQCFSQSKCIIIRRHGPRLSWIQ